jgi:ABC-type nitrate/sulfonate/bicarbonate transport system permease component
MRARVIEVVNPLGWLVVVVAIGLWQLVIETGVVNFDYMPPPSEIFDSAQGLASSGVLADSVWHTLQVTLIASGIALVVGVMLGSAVGLIRQVRTYSQGTIDVLRTIPVVAIMPVALLVWGTGSKSEIIVASFAATWPIAINTAAGVERVHPIKRDVARTFRLSRGETLRKIVFPVAMPAILVGARLSVVTALVVSIVAEMLISPNGIGYGLVFSQQALQPGDMWAYAVVAGIMGYLLNVVLVQIVRRGGANMGEAGV